LILERRPIHVNLSKDVHVEFKRLCAEERITMQEVVEYFVNGIIDERQEMVSVVKELIKLKKEKKINRISKVDKDEIFDKILFGEEV
jgi:hypothetical protein